MKPFTTIAVGIFSIVSLTHLCRLVMEWDVVVAGYTVPMWASYVGVVLAGGLAVMLWREACSGKC